MSNKLLMTGLLFGFMMFSNYHNLEAKCEEGNCVYDDTFDENLIIHDEHREYDYFDEDWDQNFDDSTTWPSMREDFNDQMAE